MIHSLAEIEVQPMVLTGPRPSKYDPRLAHHLSLGNMLTDVETTRNLLCCAQCVNPVGLIAQKNRSAHMDISGCKHKSQCYSLNSQGCDTDYPCGSVQIIHRKLHTLQLEHLQHAVL